MTRNNIKCLSDGSVAYHAAGLGVVFDPEEGAAPNGNCIKGVQKFFDMHTDDVTCIAFNPTNNDIATSENGNRPVVYIWDGLT